jgi:hypothetical protein
LQLSVKRRPASSAKHSLAVASSSFVRASIEMLLSLLFALRDEAGASAHLGGAMAGRR